MKKFEQYWEDSHLLGSKSLISILIFIHHKIIHSNQLNAKKKDIIFIILLFYYVCPKRPFSSINSFFSFLYQNSVVVVVLINIRKNKERKRKRMHTKGLRFFLIY